VKFGLNTLPEWNPVSRLAGSIWLLVYGSLLVYAWRDTTGFLFPDFANLMIHEAGHAVFSWGGETLHILGGTLGELIAPFACAVAFYFQREIYGFVFSVFWLFENFLYIGTYMSDARTSVLPLINSDESDWTILFTKWNVLQYDQQIGHISRMMGWAGMLAVMVWFARRTYRDTRNCGAGLFRAI
jgi:hypothetical protein